MAKPSGNEVRTLLRNRTFLQFGGALPSNPVKFYGSDTNYNILEGVTLPVHGAITGHYTGDPKIPNRYRLVARTEAPPSLPKASIRMLEKRGAISRQLGTLGCGFTAYVVGGDCKDLSDFLSGWADSVEIYSDAIVGDTNLQKRSDWADGLIEDIAPLTLREIYAIGSVGIGRAADSDIAVEVVDVVYGTQELCAGCGVANDGTLWQYAVQKFTGSNNATILYSVDGGSSWTAGAIAGIGASANPVAIDIVGDKLVVVVASENAYYYATINSATGVPGAFTKVTTGFVASKFPNDILVYSPSEIYFAADGGYIYKSTDITAGVTVSTAGGATTNNLKRIQGLDDTIVAVGATGTILVSANRGFSWSVATAPSADTVQGVWVQNGVVFWVVTDAGEMYYTLDGASTWTQKALSDAPTDLRDVVFVTPEVGWVTGATTTPSGLLYATWNGGRDWTVSGGSPRMVGVPTTNFQRGNRIAVPATGKSTIAANNLLVGGLGAATDGILLLGHANIF